MRLFITKFSDFVQLLLCSHHMTFLLIWIYFAETLAPLSLQASPLFRCTFFWLRKEAILVLFCQTQHVCETLSDNTYILKLITEGGLNAVVFFSSYSWKYASISNIILLSHSGPYPTTSHLSGKADAGCWICWIRHYSALLTLARFSKLFLLTLSWGVDLFTPLVPCVREMRLARDPSPSHVGPDTIRIATQFSKHASLHIHSVPFAAAMLLSHSLSSHYGWYLDYVGKELALHVEGTGREWELHYVALHFWNRVSVGNTDENNCPVQCCDGRTPGWGPHPGSQEIHASQQSAPAPAQLLMGRTPGWGPHLRSIILDINRKGG